MTKGRAHTSNSMRFELGKLAVRIGIKLKCGLNKFARLRHHSSSPAICSGLHSAQRDPPTVTRSQDAANPDSAQIYEVPCLNMSLAKPCGLRAQFINSILSRSQRSKQSSRLK